MALETPPGKSDVPRNMSMESLVTGSITKAAKKRNYTDWNYKGSVSSRCEV